MATSILDLMGHVQDQFEAGRQERKQKQIGSLAAMAYGAKPQDRAGYMQQAMALDPEAATRLQDFFDAGDDRKRQALGRAATLILEAPDEMRASLWPQIVSDLEAQGITGMKPQWSPEALPMAQQIAQAFGGLGNGAVPAGVQEFKYMTQGLQQDDVQQARRIALGLAPRASSAAIQYKVVRGADGRERLVAVDPRDVGAHVIGDGTTYGSGVGMSSPNAVTLAEPTENGVGAVRVNIEGLDPGKQEKVARTLAMMEQAGYSGEEIDAWLQSQLSQPRVTPNGANPFVGRAPEEDAAAQEAAKLRTRLAIEPQIEASKAMAVGPIEAQNAAAKTGAQERAKAQAEAQTKVETRARDSRDTLALLDEAEKWLPVATDSRLGALRDDAAAFVGQTTRGAEANDRLKIIAAELVAKVPRFEGPQSNIDVQFYREAAGDLANANLPNERRLAALQTIRRLRQKYAAGGQQQSQARRLRFNPATGRIE